MSRRRIILIGAVAAALLAASATAAPTATAPAPAPAAAPAPKTMGHGSITEGMDCSACHTVDGWEQARAPGGGGFDHARTGFPLLGAHAQTTCAGCHDGARPAQRECSTCHARDDAHAGKLGAACAECHSSKTWKDTDARARHQRTRLPLTGRHAELECSACHAAAGERTFTNVPSDCFACHEKDFRRTGIHPNHQGVMGDPAVKQFPRDCALCHRTSGWTPATVNPGTIRSASSLTPVPEGHDARFVISSGKHRAAACESCHLSLDRPSLLSCTGCHEHDVIKLRTTHRGRRVATSAGACLGCHPAGAAR